MFSAATSGQTVSKELQSQSILPTQQGHALALLAVCLVGEACQLCSLPLGHLRQCHQMSLSLPDVILSGKFPFLLFLSWSHCSSKACFAAVKVRCFCLVPSAFLPPFAFAHLGQPLLLRLHHHRSLPFVQASTALPVGPHVAGASHLIW